jgi:hypothetical protein
MICLQVVGKLLGFQLVPFPTLCDAHCNPEHKIEGSSIGNLCYGQFSTHQVEEEGEGMNFGIDCMKSTIEY